MPLLANYSPSDVTVAFGSANITGFAEGTFIEVERNEDGFTEYVGSLGEVCHTRNLNRTAKVTLTLMQTSPSNDLLMAIAFADENTGTGVLPFMVKDFNATTICYGAETRVSKLPKMERGKESGTVVWTFMTARMEIWAGGNLL